MAGLGADQPRDPVAGAGGLIHPAGFVPAGDQHLAPFVLQHPRHSCAGRLWQRAKRVAIQIDHALWQGELRLGCGKIWHHLSLACCLGVGGTLSGDLTTGNLDFLPIHALRSGATQPNRRSADFGRRNQAFVAVGLHHDIQRLIG